MGRRTSLEDLRMAIFKRNELARFLDEFPDGEELRGLPKGTASRSDAASAAVDGLIRRGHADREHLWALLAEHRPNERRKIEETRRRYREGTRQSSLGVWACAPWRGRRFMASCLVGSVARSWG